MVDPAVHRTRNRELTRATLLKVARSRFARDGFDRTSVRDIAGDAGVDPALVFRYFGSKQGLFGEALIAGAGQDELNSDPVAALPAKLLESLVFQEWPGYAGEHPLVAMLRSSAHDSVRDTIRGEVCTTYVDRLAELCDADDADLRAELLCAWILGLAVMRSVIGTPALRQAPAPTVTAWFEPVASLLMGTAVRATPGPTV